MSIISSGREEGKLIEYRRVKKVSVTECEISSGCSGMWVLRIEKSQGSGTDLICGGIS